jgi:dihydroxy-acid dehydratase
VDANTVLVLRGCGPKGYPGMPEVSNMPLQKKLLEEDVRDMVRICDGRMGGNAYGTVVLHVAPRLRPAGRWHWGKPETRSPSTYPVER